MRVSNSVKRTVAVILACILLAGLASACSDVGVDNNTANVTRRERDTVFLRDTIIARDTVSLHDTIAIKTDTVVIRKDTTIIRRDTIIVTRHDTIEVVRRDTVIITKRDTLRTGDTIRTHDPIYVHDTLTKIDTVRLRDTVTHRDTIHVLDTILLERRGLQMTGRLFVFHDAAPTTYYDVNVDTIASVLAVYFTGGQPTSIDLRLFARVPERPLVAPYETPSWCHINVLGINATNNTPAPLRNDPVKSPDLNGAGVIYRPSDSDQPKWYASSTRNETTFAVTSVNIASRRITAALKGKFYALGLPPLSPPTVRVDSLALTLAY